MPKVQVDQYRVPAFQRKRSLSAKARRVSKPVTALERMRAGMSFVKVPKKRTVGVGRASRAGGSRADASRLGVSRIGAVRADASVEDEPMFGSSRVLSSGGGSSGSGGGFGALFSSPIVEKVDESMSRDGCSSDEVREMRTCGKIVGYLEKIQVVLVELNSSVRAGDRLVFESEYGLFEQTLSSMQIDHEDVPVAYSGDSIGAKVLKEPRKGGNVYKVF